MKYSQTDQMTETSDFRRKSTLALAIAGFLILTPFSVNNFFQGRYLLGAGSLAVVIILAFNAWDISRGRYSPTFILTGLVPAILFFLVLAIRKQGIIGVVWCYPAVLSFYMMLSERKAWIANIALVLTAIPFAWSVLEYPLAARVTATLLAVSVFSAIFVRVITSQQEKLHEHAIKDPLTGLFNRSLLYPILEQAMQQNRRNGIPMSLLTIDIDHFKSINDTHGHDSGDRVLQDISNLVQKRVRSTDKVFRLGGEEFLALLHGTDEKDGRNVAEELRRTVESQELVPGSVVTVSIGLSSLRTGEDLTEWMKRGDENLYLAKQDGRNRVI